MAAPTPEYLELLTERCGFTDETADALVAQGLVNEDAYIETDMQEMVELVKGLRKVYANDPLVNFTLLGIQRLEGFAQWCKDTDRRALVAEAQNCDMVDLLVMVDRIKELKEYKRAKSALPEVKPLKDLKDWRTFREALSNRLTKERGASTAPLIYVTRTSTAPTVAPADADYDDMMYLTLAVEGAHFKYDSKTVWGILKALTVDGPAWTHIKRFDRKQDGRGAVLMLDAQMDGQNSHLLRRQEAYATFKHTFYRGHRKAFTFEMFIEKFLGAFNELEATGEPMSESRKVTVFLGNISDATLETAKTVIYGDAVKQQDFQECQQYLSTIIASQKVHSNVEASPRSVAQFDTNDTGGTVMSEDGTLSLDKDKQYSDQEWQSLTRADKTKIFDLRHGSSRKRSGGGNGGGNGRNKRNGGPGGSRDSGSQGSKKVQLLKRKLAALKQSKEEAALERQIAAIEGVTNDDEGEGSKKTPDDNAGSQFGRNAHKKNR